MIDAEQLLREVSVTRLLVFLEVKPQSNQYRQVYLNPERFKQMSDVVCGGPAKSEDDTVMIKVSDEVYPLPDLPDIQWD
jgi:hypothetical protein